MQIWFLRFNCCELHLTCRWRIHGARKLCSAWPQKRVLTSSTTGNVRKQTCGCCPVCTQVMAQTCLGTIQAYRSVDQLVQRRRWFLDCSLTGDFRRQRNQSVCRNASVLGIQDAPVIQMPLELLFPAAFWWLESRRLHCCCHSDIAVWDRLHVKHSQHCHGAPDKGGAGRRTSPPGTLGSAAGGDNNNNDRPSCRPYGPQRCIWCAAFSIDGGRWIATEDVAWQAMEVWWLIGTVYLAGGLRGSTCRPCLLAVAR